MGVDVRVHHGEDSEAGTRSQLPSPKGNRWATIPKPSVPGLSRLHGKQEFMLGETLVFERIPQMDVQELMGKCARSPITGQVRMQQLNKFPDFLLVDLWTRPVLSGPLKAFEQDRYLFRAVPLGYRTWMYHELFLSRQVLKCHDENGMMKEVLSARCIDAPITAGRGSPLMCLAPAALLLTVTGDTTLILLGLVTLLAIYGLTLACNSPKWYRLMRPACLPFKLIQFSALIWGLHGDLGVMGLIGILLACLLHLIDFVVGDLSVLLYYRLHCSYDVLATLPNRVLLCRRYGAAHVDDMFSGEAKQPIAESITGIGNWERTFVLIADVYGFLVELRSMHPEDWKKLWEEFAVNHTAAQRFVGLDCYNWDRPTMNSMKAKDADSLKQEIERHRKEHPFLDPVSMQEMMAGHVSHIGSEFIMSAEDI